MPGVKGAALRAGFWSQVALASMGKLGRSNITRRRRERCYMEKGETDDDDDGEERSIGTSRRL